VRTGHTSAPKGSHVIVFLRDGTKVTGVFSDTKSRWIALDNGRKIMRSDVRTMSILHSRRKMS
jgi:predicted alpha/beta superfamily hydrolase